MMEEYDGRHENGTLLTQEEETSLRLLEPLFTRHRDRILETLAPHLGSDHDRASLLSDDLAVARLKRSQQEYLFSLPNGNNGEIASRNAAQAPDYRGPFGLGAGWHLRTFVHFLTSIQPLVFDAFGNRPHLYHTVWNALLKVIFHDLELAMSESLAQRDDLLEEAGRDMSEMKRALNLALGKQVVEERQRQAEQRTVVSLLTTWLTKTSGLAQEMGTPLNVILGQAELLLERTGDEKAQAALQSIVRQVERLIPMRQQMCALNHGLRSSFPQPDFEAMAEGPLPGG
jgi:signal transduction histidine kinase